MGKIYGFLGEKKAYPRKSVGFPDLNPRKSVGFLGLNHRKSVFLPNNKRCEGYETKDIQGIM
ncbi:MAG TPA: hypothetical protein H9814_10785 [Candidatus Bacteroides merdigallinarum]|uniref:Uncharacterized protein n=1 Tax=Candidatus Bacteroides merdigallinarum TaxID=2838473 RepID=A0A9D2J2F0_9BACE|nr:hypothetical protein [Candidatus Bacteroides merdigallinarum]